MISGLFGLNPTPVGAPHEGGCFEPSPLALWLAIDKTLKYTEFDWSDEQKALLKGKKIIVLCTEDQFLKCENGTFFSTGQHPVETSKKHKAKR
jgi:D-lactate dehydratase / protein deglycase